MQWFRRVCGSQSFLGLKQGHKIRTPFAHQPSAVNTTYNTPWFVGPSLFSHSTKRKRVEGRSKLFASFHNTFGESHNRRSWFQFWFYHSR